MPPPNHDSLPKGIPKIKSQASTAQNLETLQSQSRQGCKKRLSLNRLRVLYGRLINFTVAKAYGSVGFLLLGGDARPDGMQPGADRFVFVRPRAIAQHHAELL
jgi:hypothetical protein